MKKLQVQVGCLFLLLSAALVKRQLVLLDRSNRQSVVCTRVHMRACVNNFESPVCSTTNWAACTEIYPQWATGSVIMLDS